MVKKTITIGDYFKKNEKESRNRFETAIPLYAFIIGIIVTIAVFLINIYAIMWIYKLEKIECACSDSWMRTYIKYYLHVLIPIQAISLLMNIYLYSTNNMKMLNQNSFLNAYVNFTKIISLFGVVNIFVVIVFINKLKEINCYCSEDIKREVYWIYNIIQLSIIAISLFFILIGGFTMLLLSGGKY
jgi:hypothetical protein